MVIIIMNVLLQMYKTSSPLAVREYTDDAADTAYIKYLFMPK